MPAYIKDIARVIGYTLLGALATLLVGYLLGAMVGIRLTWENNNMPDTPYGSYSWWANFVGLITAIFAWLPGAFFGFLWGLIDVLKRRKASAEI